MADPEKLAAELERLREEARSNLEARRVEIAEQVEKARVAAEESARDERKRLASGLEEAHGIELAHVKWRIDGHDEHFGALDGSVEKLASAVEHQAGATRDLRQEMRDSFTAQESAALNREVTAAKQVKDAGEKAEEKADASKAESRRLILQFAGVVLVALIAALGTIVVAVIG